MRPERSGISDDKEKERKERCFTDLNSENGVVVEIFRVAREDLVDEGFVAFSLNEELLKGRRTDERGGKD